jgi:hypothetical protein
MLFAVYAVYEERNQLIGHVECDSMVESYDDVKAYFEGQEGYRLELTEVKPIKIPKGYAKKKAELVKKKKELEAQLQEIKQKLKW